MVLWGHVAPGANQKDTHSEKKIGLHAQNMITILSSVVKIFKRNLCDHLLSTRIFTFINESDIHMNSEIDEASDYGHDLDSLTRYPSYTNHMFHILGELG